MIALVVVMALAGMVVLMVVGAYNRLVALRQSADNAFADIGVALKRRQELVTSLVETMKNSADVDRGALEEIIAALQAASAADGVEGRVAAENAVSEGLARLLALARSRPDPKENPSLLQLQADLKDIEIALATAGRFFNSAVAEFDAQARSFPAVLFAKALGFTRRDALDLGESRALAAPLGQSLRDEAADIPEDAGETLRGR